MDVFILLTALLITFIIPIIVIIWILWAMWTQFYGSVPFIPTPTHALGSVLDELSPKRGSVVYDLGCGNGKVLFACARRFPDISAVGIEHDFFPYAIARIRKFFYNKNSRIQFIWGNFMKTDLLSATHIFLYLYPSVLDKLLPKLERELLPGTKIVSCDYEFKNKMASRVVEIKTHNRLGRRLFVYEF